MPAAVVVIGASWGGLRALQTVLSGLPSDFALPIIAVQHRAKDSGDELTENLREKCALRVTEAEDKQPILPGHVYLAPPDYHLLFDEGALALTTDPPVRFGRPSIDVCFESAAEAYGSGVIGVVLSGANHDGTQGLLRIKELGGTALVQDPATAEGPVMPASAIAAVVVDAVLALEEISGALLALAKPTQGDAHDGS